MSPVNKRLSESAQTNLDIVGGALLRSFLIGGAILIGWALMILLLGDFVFGVNQSIWGFTITRDQFTLFNLCGIGLFKMTLLFLFLAPYLAIEWLLWDRSD